MNKDVERSEYVNRYGEVFTFTQLSEKEILWEGDFNYHRVGFDIDPNILNMVDPSGGPYIETGMNMTRFNPSLKGVVDGFQKIETGYKILLK